MTCVSVQMESRRAFAGPPPAPITVGKLPLPFTSSSTCFKSGCEQGGDTVLEVKWHHQHHQRPVQRFEAFTLFHLILPLQARLNVRLVRLITSSFRLRRSDETTVFLGGSVARIVSTLLPWQNVVALGRCLYDCGQM